MTKRQRRRRIDPDIMEAIEDMAAKGIGGAAITRALEKDGRFAGRVPSERTVQNVVRELSPPDPSESWSLADAADGEEAAMVLPVLAAVIRASAGKVSMVTRSEADWIVKLSRVAGDLPAWALYRLAGKYQRCQVSGRPTRALDILVAFAPWRGSGAWERYGSALADELLSAHMRSGPVYDRIELALRNRDRSLLPSRRELTGAVRGAKRTVRLAHRAAALPEPVQEALGLYAHQLGDPLALAPLWAWADSYEEMLERLGFSRELIEKASSYSELLEMQRRLDIEGSHGSRKEAT